MYLTTSTRPDVAYVVHQLCKCMQKPTPALLRETDYVFSYLSRNASVGLTYTGEYSRLKGFSDASWEAQLHLRLGHPLAVGRTHVRLAQAEEHRALHTCEAEIITLSEAAKDVLGARCGV